MKRIGIFYASTTGTTAEVAHQIASELNIPDADVHDVAQSAPTDVTNYEVALLGTSTWGAGDLQDDMADFTNGLSAMDLEGMMIGLFGTGDESFGDTFCEGVGILYDRLKGTGAEFIGQFNADGYVFDHSGAVRDGKVVGLLIDNTNRPEATPGLIDEWATIVKNAAEA